MATQKPEDGVSILAALGGPSLSEIERETQWNDSEVPILRRMFRYDGATFIAYDTMIRNLVCLGLEFVPKDKGAKVNQLFSELVKKKGTPLVEQVAQEIFTFGYCAFRKVEDELSPGTKRKIVYPQVVEREFYTGRTVIYKDGRRKYIATPTSGMQGASKDPIYILADESMMPDPRTGKHRSTVAMYQYEYDFKMTTDHFYLQGMSQRSKPPVVIEHDPAVVAQTLATPLSATSVAPGTNLPSGLFAMRLLRVPGHENDTGYTSGELGYMGGAFSGNFEPNTDTPVIKQHITDNEYRPRTGYDASTDSSVYIVEKGLRIATKQPTPPEVDNFAKDSKIEYLKTVLKYWAIPIGLVETSESGTGNLRLDSNDLLQFNTTLQVYRRMFTRFIEEMYQIILDSDDLGGEFLLDSVPRITLQQVLTLYSHDVIGRRDMQDIALKLCGLPPDMRLSGKNYHHVPPIGLSENATTRIIDAREEGILATASKDRALGSDMKQTKDARIDLLEAQATNQEEMAKHQGDKPASAPPPSKKAKKS